eukprot:s3180_g1.t1
MEKLKEKSLDELRRDETSLGAWNETRAKENAEYARKSRFCDNNCSCNCAPPSTGRMCSIIDEDAATRSTCPERKQLGPSRQYTYVALVEKTQDALNSLSCCLHSFFSWSPGKFCIMSFVSPLVSCCTFTRRVMAQSSVGSPEHMHETMLIGGVILLVSLVLIVCWNGIYLLGLWALFPYYTMFRKGRWPHADRAILFCVGEMDFGSYIFPVQVAKTIYSLRGLFKTLAKHPNLQELVSDWIPRITNADAIVLTEVVTLYALVGMAESQFHQSPPGFLVCVLLILLEIAEIIFLYKTRRDSQRFASFESLFAVIQDLPEFFFTAFVSVFGSWNQYVLYTLVSSTIALLTTLARSCRHDSVMNDPAELWDLLLEAGL